MVGLFTGDDGAGLMLVLCFYLYLARDARRELSTIEAELLVSYKLAGVTRT